MSWWIPYKFNEKKLFLEQRMKLMKTVRQFFDDQDFWEVETPALQIMPGAEVHVHAFETNLLSPDLQTTQKRYLHTSPEFAMKKLLVAGLPKIYQICPVYRNAEGSSLHSCEFKMLEWYRTSANYEEIMQDTIRLLRCVAEQLHITEYRYQDFRANPFQEWQKITVSEAFAQYANIDLIHDWLPEIQEMGIKEWDERFFKVFLEQIEPHLGQGAPTILYDYPAHMAALSKIKKEDHRFAERFEVYVCGMELANAFTELTNAETQKKRFEEDMKQKEIVYRSSWPIDDDFIKALEHGMPSAGGIALGIDRLAMLATGADHIRQVLFAD